MYLIPGLGDDALEPVGLDYIGRSTYLAWTKAVAARGGLAVRLIPQPGDRFGPLGERYPESVIAQLSLGTPRYWSNVPINRPVGAPAINGTRFGYYNAPLLVRALDSVHLVDNAITITEGKVAAVAQDLTSGLLGSVVATLAIGAATYLALTHHRSS